MTAHFPLARLRDALVADGITCVIHPGAQGRSARRFTGGYYQGCQASVVHHTAGSGNNPVNDINYILSGKGEGYVIANAYTAKNGTVHLLASGPTYTEGQGGPWGIIPANRANDVAFSDEVANPGDGTPYPEEQQTAVLALHRHVNRIAADVWDWPDDPYSKWRLFSHFEWAPGRKIDPYGPSRWSPDGGFWDMDAFRADTTGEDMLTFEHPNQRILDTRDGIGIPTNTRIADPVIIVADGLEDAVSVELNCQIVAAPVNGWLEVAGRSVLPWKASGADTPANQAREANTIRLPGFSSLVVAPHHSPAHVIIDVVEVVRRG